MSVSLVAGQLPPVFFICLIISFLWLRKRTLVTKTVSYVEEVSYEAIIIQQDATIYSLFISVNCSTCYRWYLHPSSGAHITVSTVSGINETVTATFTTGSSNGLINARYCRYSDMSS